MTHPATLERPEPTLFDLDDEIPEERPAASPGRPVIPASRTYTEQHPATLDELHCSDCQQPIPDLEQIGWYGSHIGRGWFALCHPCSPAETRRLIDAQVLTERQS